MKTYELVILKKEFTVMNSTVAEIILRGAAPMTSLAMQGEYSTPFEDAKNAAETALIAVGYSPKEVAFFVTDGGSIWEFDEFIEEVVKW